MQQTEEDKEKQNNSKQIILYIFIGILVIFVIYVIYRYITEIRDYHFVSWNNYGTKVGGYVNADIDEDYYFRNYINVIIGSLFRIGGQYKPYTF